MTAITRTSLSRLSKTILILWTLSIILSYLWNQHQLLSFAFEQANVTEGETNPKLILMVIGHFVLWIIITIVIFYVNRQMIKGFENNRFAYLAVKENEARTQAILSSSLDAIITINATNNIIDWNSQAEHVFGWTKEDVVGKELSELIIPEQFRERHTQGIKNYLATGKGPILNSRIQVSALKFDGSEFPIELAIVPIIIKGSQAFSAFIRDITEQEKAQAQIKNDYHSQHVISSVLEISTHSISFKEKLEMSLDEILSTPWLRLQGKGLIFLVDEHSNSLELIAQRGVSDFIIKNCSKVDFGQCLCGMTAKEERLIFKSCLDKDHSTHHHGMAQHGHYSIPIMSDDKIKGVLNLYLNHHHKSNDREISYLKMITNTLGHMIKQHEHEQQLEHFAYYDKLTKLPNRALLVNRIEHCLQQSKRDEEYNYAVLYLDLDKFKKINDSHGHSIGDQVLDQIAEKLKSCVRDFDTVARLGGDEFAILLNKIDNTSDAFRTASRIHQQLVEPLLIEHHEIYTSTSIGIAQGLSSYTAHNDLLRDADIAMYRAKEKGTGHTEIFDANMHTNAVNMLSLETDLRHALERNEFQIHLQPIVSLKENKIVGFESLVRWKNESRGFVFPDDFIPLAEETGLINEIGLWVLEESCRQIKIWNEKYPDYKSLYVSVNLSPVQFLRKDLIAKIDSRLQSISFNTDNLRLEITESTLMENPKSVALILKDLKHRNIKLYLDDFGTGYSSLSYLQNFPYDTLKIDRCFVSRLGEGKEHTNMVKTIIEVARNFNMGVIAEGVENEQELSILRELGCNYIQGYYFSKPVNVVEAEKLLTSDFLNR